MLRPSSLRSRCACWQCIDSLSCSLAHSSRRLGSSLRAACQHGDMQSDEHGSYSDFMAVQEAIMLMLCSEVMQSSTPYASVTSSSKKGAGVW